MTEVKQSLVPRVIDALVAHAKAAVPEDFPVLDGPVREMDSMQKFLLVGWSGQPDTRGIEVVRTRSGASQRTGAITVHGAVQVALGKDGQKGARDAAYAVLDGFAALVNGRLDVRGVTKSELTDDGVEPYIGSGAGCFVTFTIRIEGNL